jgi:hypothetical protein
MSEKNTWADQTPRFVAEDAVDSINVELVRAGNLPLLACQVPTAVKVITQIAAGSYQAGRDIALDETRDALSIRTSRILESGLFGVWKRIDGLGQE